MRLLELFAWARSMWKAAEELWWGVFSVDWTEYDEIDLNVDIENLRIEDLPRIPDHVHASFDCTTYTMAAIKTHRRWIQPYSDYAIKCDRVNQHVIKLIKKLQKINPKLTFSFENPRAMLRKMPFMQEFTRHTVWYCQYWFDIAKPTDIWTNAKNWKPKPVCKNHIYDKVTKEQTSTHCHHQPARRWAKTWLQGIKGSHLRSIIPKELCIEILQSLTK